jgi:cytochrome P450 PksS
MTFNLKSPDMRRDPYPTYAQMRRQTTPVTVAASTTGKSTLFFTRYDDVMAILKDSRFINDMRRLPNAEDWTKKWYIPSTIKNFVNSMALVDDPDHARLRRLVHKAFTPSTIQSMAGSIEEWAERSLDACAGKPVIDFIADFALPVPLNVISDLMGVEIADRARFRRWMSNNISDFSLDNRLELIPKLINTMQLDGFLRRLIQDRRAAPKPDLTTALVQAEDGGDTLSEPELTAMLFLLLFAGHETTVNLIGSGTLALLQNPDQFDDLKAHPDLLDSAIDEMLRFTSPVQHIAIRYATVATEIGGVPIPQSAEIMLGIAAANYDETVFDEPERFDIRRSPNKHIAFGFGMHYCLGAPLARLEARLAFEVLFRRYPNLTLAVPPETLTWRGAPALRGLTRLPIRLHG